jgi:hypothetical protein
MADSAVQLDFSHAEPISAVSLDFAKAQPISARPVSLDFSQARPISSSVTLDFTKAQPAHDPNDRFVVSGQGELRTYEPSVWERIKSAVTAGIPRYSSRTVNNPKYGDMQLLSPEEALTPSEQRAHPIATGVGEFAGGLTSPSSVGLIAGTGGLGELPGAAAMLQRLMSAGFGGQAIYSGLKNVPAIRDAWDRGDASEVERLLTHTVLNLAMGAAATQHAATGAGAVTGKANEPATAPNDGVTHGVEPTSALGEVLKEHAPSVRVAGSAAAAREIIEKDTQSARAEGVTSLKGTNRSYGAGQDPTEPESTLKPDKPAKEFTGERARGNVRGAAGIRPDEGASDQSTASRLGPGTTSTEAPRSEARVTASRDTATFRNTARVVSGEHIPVVSRDEILFQSIQNVIDNSGELRRAGVDPSTIQTTADVDAVLQRASDHIKSNLDPRASATIGFEAQKQLAADLNMSVEDLLSRRGGQAYNTEEAVAARSILKESAVNVVRLSQIAAQTANDAALKDASIALAQHQAIQEKVAGITAEAGRALGGFRIGGADLPQVKIANVLSKLTPEAQTEAVRLMSKMDPTDPMTVRRLNQFTERIKPSTTLDKLFEYYRNALLSSPHTIIVKTASEAAMVALETMKKAIAGGVAKFKDRPDRFAAESWYYAKGLAQALAEHAKPILSGEFQLEGSPGFERAGTQAIKGKLGSVVRAPSEAMSRMTNLLYAGTYFGEINAHAARRAIAEGLEGDVFHARQEYLSHHPTEDMRESAHDLATTNTFQNELTGFTKKIGEAIASKPTAPWLPESLKSVSPLKWLFPFYRTPVNLVKASLTHMTPYELLNGIAKGDTDAMARGVLGSSIAASLAALALSGHITGGGPTDYKKEETLRATGWQPYSLKIGDKYYSYHRFEPVGLAAGLVADAIHGMKSGDSEVVSQSKADTAVKHIMRNLDDMPFMGTLANLLQSVHDPVGGRAQSFINREAGSLVPAGVANIAESMNRTVRRPQTALQAVQSRIPGLTQAAPPIIDVTGNQVQRPANNLGGANPFPVTTAKHDPVVDELSRLGISTPQPPMQIKWKGKPTPLTDAERQRFAIDEGQELYKRVGKLMQSGSWQRRTDDQKRKALVELHRMMDDARSARLTKLRRPSQTQLARFE